LHHEQIAAIQLDQKLTERTHELDSERLYRQNAENTLQAAGERIRADEISAKELQESSRRFQEDTSQALQSLFYAERGLSLEARLRELEVNLQQVVNANHSLA